MWMFAHALERLAVLFQYDRLAISEPKRKSATCHLRQRETKTSIHARHAVELNLCCHVCVALDPHTGLSYASRTPLALYSCVM